MRLSARVYLTGVVFLAYVMGGLIAPVAHHHHHDNCCHSTGECDFSHNANSSQKHHCSHQPCPFGHVDCEHSASDKPSPEGSVPTAPHDDCVVCRLLYMATTAVEFVSLPMCEAVVTEASQQRIASALIGDIAFPTQRGPPACV